MTRRRKPATRSGPNIPEAQRSTARVVLRLDPDIAEELRELAAVRGGTVSEAVAALVMSSRGGS